MGRDMTICNLLAVAGARIPPRFGAGTEDAAEIFAAIAPELTRFMAWEPPASPTAHADVWRNWLPTMAAGTDQHLVIRLKGRRGISWEGRIACN